MSSAMTGTPVMLDEQPLNHHHHTHFDLEFGRKFEDWLKVSCVVLSNFTSLFFYHLFLYIFNADFTMLLYSFT